MISCCKDSLELLRTRPGNIRSRQSVTCATVCELAWAICSILHTLRLFNGVNLINGRARRSVHAVTMCPNGSACSAAAGRALHRRPRGRTCPSDSKRFEPTQPRQAAVTPEPQAAGLAFDGGAGAPVRARAEHRQTLLGACIRWRPRPQGPPAISSARQRWSHATKDLKSITGSRAPRS